MKRFLQHLQWLFQLVLVSLWHPPGGECAEAILGGLKGEGLFFHGYITISVAGQPLIHLLSEQPCALLKQRHFSVAGYLPLAVQW